jgi:hypothetical protein
MYPDPDKRNANFGRLDLARSIEIYFLVPKLQIHLGFIGMYPDLALYPM